jgi:hypothetical protein
MALNLIKLCVGCDSVKELQGWIKQRIADKKKRGETPEHIHTTRMMPKRCDELLDGGSLYWVIRGNMQARQRLLAIRPFRDGDGVRRCRLVLDPEVTPTEWHPRRAFQGWRYLTLEDAPRDLGAARAGLRKLPPELRRDLADLGLL